GIGDQLVDARPLEVDHLTEAFGDVVIDTAQVVALELVLPATAEPLEQLPHTGHPLPLAVAEALLQHPPQGLVEVPVVEQVVGDLAEHVVGVEVEAGLGAIPARVLEAGHVRSLATPVGGPATHRFLVAPLGQVATLDDELAGY